MTALSTRNRLVILSAIVLSSKLLQWTVDSQPLWTIDSTAFVLNALNASVPERSYLYGWVIRFAAIPFDSLRPLVAVQMLAGATVAGMLAVALVRYCHVRFWIAAAAALLFAWDPTQVVHEHLVLTECLAGLAAALFMLVGLEYLRDGRPGWLMVLGLLGAVAVGFRLVYVPVVLASGVILPLAASVRTPFGAGKWKSLVIGVGAVALGQIGYQDLTGRLLQREPAYHYRTGFFMLGNVAPIVVPEDAADPTAAATIAAQQRSPHPLADANPTNRNFHLWRAGGLVDRLKRAYGGDVERANREAQRIAVAAIRRTPVGFLELGIAGWRHYPIFLGEIFSSVVSIEDGSSVLVQSTAEDWAFLKSHFRYPNEATARDMTPSRRYHQYSRFWCWMQFLSPLLGLAACLAAAPGTRRAVGWIALWSALVIAATCLTTPVGIRYLHPLSFSGLASLAVLGERFLLFIVSKPLSRL